MGGFATTALVVAGEYDASHLGKQGINVRNMASCSSRELLALHASALATNSGILCIYNIPPAISFNDGFESRESAE